MTTLWSLDLQHGLYKQHCETAEIQTAVLEVSGVFADINSLSVC